MRLALTPFPYRLGVGIAGCGQICSAGIPIPTHYAQQLESVGGENGALQYVWATLGF